MVPPVGVVGIDVWGYGWWLVLATTLACLAIKSLTEGTLGHYSPWCSMD